MVDNTRNKSVKKKDRWPFAVVLVIVTVMVNKNILFSLATVYVIVIVNDRNTNRGKSETVLLAAGHWRLPAIIPRLQQLFAHLVTIHVSSAVSTPQASPQLKFFDVTKMANKLLGDLQFTSYLSCYRSVNNTRVVKYLKYKYFKYVFQILGKYFVFCILAEFEIYFVFCI